MHLLSDQVELSMRVGRISKTYVSQGLKMLWENHRTTQTDLSIFFCNSRVSAFLIPIPRGRNFFCIKTNLSWLDGRNVLRLFNLISGEPCLTQMLGCNLKCLRHTPNISTTTILRVLFYAFFISSCYYEENLRFPSRLMSMCWVNPLIYWPNQAEKRAFSHLHVCACVCARVRVCVALQKFPGKNVNLSR